MKKLGRSICRTCGENIIYKDTPQAPGKFKTWGENRIVPFNLDNDMPHACKANVKTYSKEEMNKMYPPRKLAINEA